jgi:hypothetical protein
MVAIMLVVVSILITTVIISGVYRAGGVEPYLHGVASAIIGRVEIR